MASSIVDKYEQILAADPRSRIFVELAKALVDRGEHARAVEICQRGLEHHPTSILGRVTWGRALLETGDAKGAMDQFEIAIALEPAKPYAYNLVAEALVAKELYREALPVLARAAELQPADDRVRNLLENAKERVKAAADAAAAPSTGIAPEDRNVDGRADAAPERASGADAAGASESSSGVDAGAGGSQSAVGESTESSTDAAASAASSIDPAHGNEADTAGATQRATDAATDGAAASASGSETATTTTTGTATAAGSPSEAAAAAVAATAAGGADASTASAGEATDPSARTPAPPLPPPLPPEATPASARNTPRSLLQMIPDAAPDPDAGALASSNLPAAAAPQSSAAHADPAEAERAAAEYERRLRDQLRAADPPPPTFIHRHRRLVLGTALVVALGAAAAVYLVVSYRNAAHEAAGAATRARAGLARDTLASLREAHRLLTNARKYSDAPEIASLGAQVAAVLAAEHGDEAARSAARALIESGSAGDGAVAASWLLASTPAERAEMAEAVLAAPASVDPLLDALAGRILVARGEVEPGRARLELAARANPPLLRALCDLGDVLLAAGDAEAALAYFGAALEAHKTHPRAATGAAEARLALGRDLETARRELAAVEADPGSPPPLDARLRFEIARARVDAALGEPGPAAVRLARAAEKAGETAKVAATIAELHLQGRAWEQAEAAASRAVAQEPANADYHVLLARARIGRGRFVEAIAATNGVDGRAVRIQRAIARYRLGQWNEARAELQKTARDGKVTPDVAVWYALIEVGAGKPERALALLEKLVQAKVEPPLVRIAMARTLETLGRRAEAEAAYREAAERDPDAPEPHAGLGRLLLASGRAKDALEPLERAVKIDASDFVVRRALAEARLAAGQPAAARSDLDSVLLVAPKDVTALRLLSTAWLEEGEPREARVAADRAVRISPRDPSALVAAARAAQAAGDPVAARTLAQRAMAAGAAGTEREEAKRIVGSMLPRKAEKSTSSKQPTAAEKGSRAQVADRKMMAAEKGSRTQIADRKTTKAK